MELKPRISKRTGLKGKVLENVKVALVPKSIYQRPRYLEDGELLNWSDKAASLTLL